MLQRGSCVKIIIAFRRGFDNRYERGSVVNVEQETIVARAQAMKSQPRRVPDGDYAIRDTPERSRPAHAPAA
jgi:hypothetical protein